MATRPDLSAEEKKRGYSKYYNLEMTPIPQEKLKILTAGPIDPVKALSIEHRNDLFKPGYFDVEIGYCTMPDGTGYLANLTTMPEVTTEMFDWWFAWHSLEDLRYRIWDPEDHFYARANDRNHVLDKNLPLRKRTWGVSHTVREDIGPGPDDLIIEFKDPADLGFDAEKIGTAACATIMAANGHSPEGAQNKMAAVMTHFVRELDQGIELRSRFWIGCQIINGQPVKVIPDAISVPEIATKGLFAHNLKEFTHLATILPKVYAEEKDNWLD
jgi:hypothetical protein